MTLRNVQSIGSLPKSHGEPWRSKGIASNNDKQDERQRQRIVGHRVLSSWEWGRMEGADNMVYICNTESLKEKRGVRSCSLASVHYFTYIALRFPVLSSFISSLFLTQRLWILHRGFVTLFIRLINSLSFPCSLFADFNTGETRDTVCQD